MKLSKVETALSLAASAFGLICVFYKPLGLSESWQWCALILAFVCVIPLRILQKRRRDRRLRGEIPPAVKAPRGRFWLVLGILVLVTLSGPLWLPYTGTTLPLPLMLVTSVVSCIVLAAAFVFARR